MREALAVLALIALLPLGGLEAQETVEEMTAECAGDPTRAAFMTPFCRHSSLNLAAFRAGVGLAASQGSAVPGSASTLGRRMASSPRVALSLRGGVARAAFAGTAAKPDARAFYARTLEGQVTVGLVEGWSLMPTVGGFLSVDLLGSLGLVALPDAFDGALQSAGYGVRVGLFRESFTLPGVSVSATRRHLSEAGSGSTAAGSRLEFDPRVTSLRATVAKDLLAFGVLGGWGWDRYDGSSSLDIVRPSPLGVAVRGQAASDDFHTDRQLLFGGLSYTLLVLQLSLEGGWAGGFDAPTGPNGWDPDSGSLFGSFAARLTY